MPNTGNPESTSFATSEITFGIAEGSPGPLLNIIPSGFQANRSSAFESQGKTLISHPLSTRQVAILFFKPKSKRAILCPSLISLKSYGSLTLTSPLSASPFIEGTSASFCLSLSKSNSSVESMQFIAPFILICLTRALVSTSLIPTVPLCSRLS